MNVKKIIILLGITLLFFVLIWGKYKAKDDDYKEYYVLQVGAYQNYDNVVKNTRNFENYIIYEEDNLYKIFIGIAKEEEIFSKLNKIYSENIETLKKVIKIKDEEFDKKIETYEKVIKNSENKEELNIVIKEELKLLEKLLNKEKEM